MTPAYDPMNTRIHIPNETAAALDLFEDGFETESYRANGFFAGDDRVEVGRRPGVDAKRAIRFVDDMCNCEQKLSPLLEASFLVAVLIAVYEDHVADRIKTLRYSHSPNKRRS
jgi:serine/threonine-protein kinase HipA